MKPEPGRGTPHDLLDGLRRHPGWTDRERDAVLDRLVERFPADDLVAAVLDRLDELGEGDAEALLRIVEAHPRPHLLRALAEALAAQPDLPPERAWDALAVLDGAGVLGDHPDLAERWDELSEGLDEEGSIEELAGQIEEDPEGVWMALQGLAAVEPEVRPQIVASLARVPLGPGLVEFLRLLSYSHHEPTRAAALAALAADPGDNPSLRGAWLDLSAHHPDPGVVSAATGRLGGGTTGLPAASARADPSLVRSLVSSIDGGGRATVVLSARREGKRMTAAFLCDVERGVVEVVGEVEPDTTQADASFEDLSDRIGRDVVDGAGPLALGLLAGSLWLSGPATPPSWRFWVEETAGSLRPRPFRADLTDGGGVADTPVETVGRARAVLDACPDWVDASPLTYELAEEIVLREGRVPPDPKRDSGAYRFLFEHRLQGRLENYRRMLLWMAGFWRGSGDDRLCRAAVDLAAQLSDAQNVVPGHPFTVALTTRSLAAAMDGLARGVDPRRPKT